MPLPRDDRSDCRRACSFVSQKRDDSALKLRIKEINNTCVRCGVLTVVD